MWTYYDKNKTAKLSIKSNCRYKNLKDKHRIQTVFHSKHAAKYIQCYTDSDDQCN